MPGNSTSGNKTGSPNSNVMKKLNSILPDEKALDRYYKLREKKETQLLKKMGKLKDQLDDKSLKELEKKTNKYMSSIGGSFQLERMRLAEEKAEKGTVKEQLGKNLADYGKNLQEGLKQSISALGSFIGKGVNNYLDSYSKYFSNIETRLLGSGNDYNNVMKVINNGIRGSQATSTLKVLDNLNKLVSEGISYNVEQRAVLQTLNEKIAATFDATNGTLTRLIRLYQSDTTAAYLGMENILTQFLNAGYNDTSYLAKGVSDSVSESLLEVTSQLGKNAGAEFEYVVQKWLGAFSSAGMSENTITGLAAAIGQLGSGDIGSLSSSNFNNLLTIAASKAGLDYSNLLNGGLNASNTNRLFQGILAQLLEINSTSPRVARNQYASVFGMGLSDITAALNIGPDRLKSLQNSVYDYNTFVSQTEYELGRVNARTSAKERIDNVISNVMSVMGEGIASNGGLYTAYMINDMIDQMTGGIKVPLPFTSSLNLNNVAKVGIIGYSALSQIGSILSALSGNGRLSLNNFGGSEYITSSGEGLAITANARNTLTSTTSSVGYVGSSSSSDILSGSLADSTEQNKTITSNAGMEEQDIYAAIAEEGGTNSLISALTEVVIDIREDLRDLTDNMSLEKLFTKGA